MNNREVFSDSSKRNQIRDCRKEQWYGVDREPPSEAKNGAATEDFERVARCNESLQGRFYLITKDLKDIFTGYRLKGVKGVTDLSSKYPYFGEYHIYRPAFDIAEKKYLEDPAAYEAKIDMMNREYIDTLKASGEYNKEFHTEIMMMNLPGWDNVSIKPGPLTSCRVVMLNFEDLK